MKMFEICFERRWNLCRHGLPAMVTFLVILLTACGGGGGGGGDNPPQPLPVETLAGTAAAGAPIIGTVNVRGGNGAVSYSAIRSDGTFSVDVTSLDAPYVVWASGSANGRSVTLYSTCYALANVNVTPATHLALALALGQDPAAYFPTGAAPPDETDLDAAVATVADLMKMVFDSLGITGFDIMGDTFAADGTGFDELLDVLDMEVSGQSAQVADKAGGTVLFTHDLNDPAPTISSDDQTTVNDAVVAGLEVLDQIRLFLDTIEQLYSGANEPSLEDLRNALLPANAEKMSADFLDSGNDREDTLDAWVDPVSDEGPSLGITIGNVSLVRRMQRYDLGDPDPITVDEKGTNFDGVWVAFTVTENGISEVVKTAFVQEAQGGAWKWAGDRNPFHHGGDVGVAAVRDFGRIYSGISFWVEDEGNLAMDRGIVRLGIFNPALPSYIDAGTGNTFHCLIMERTDPLVAEWDITSASALWGQIYSQTDGLDLSRLTDPEFLFVAFDNAGMPVNVWLDRIPALPIAETVIAANPNAYFPTVLTIGGMPVSGVIPSSAINGDVTVTWQHPSDAGLKPESSSLMLFNGSGDYFSFTQENPSEDNPGLDPRSWTSATHTVAYTGTLNSVRVAVGYEDDAGREFISASFFDLGALPRPGIQINGCYLHYRTNTDTARDAYRGWIDFRTLGGAAIIASDVSSIALSGPGGNVAIDHTLFEDAEYTAVNWSETQMTLVEAGQRFFSGFQIHFPAGTVLNPGNYTYTVTAQNGAVLTRTITYPGREDMPVIDVNSMSSSFDAEGNMTLSWTNPPDVTVYDQLCLRIYNNDVDPNEQVFSAAMTQSGRNLNRLVLSAEDIQEARIQRDPNSLRWRLETRRVSPQGFHYARGQTSNLLIADW